MASGGSNQTTTTKIPQWMSDGGQATYNAANDYVKNNPVTPYAGERSAPANPNIGGAVTQAAGAAGTGQQQVATGTGLATQAGGAVTPHAADPRSFTSAGIASSYMNPYVQQVQQNTLRQMDRQATINQGAVNDAAGSAKAFGGDRHAIVAAEQAKNDAQGERDYIDQSNAAAYNAAQGQFNNENALNTQNNQFNSGLTAADLDRMNQSAGILGQLGNTSAGIASSDTQRLLQSGLAAQDTAQTADDNAYQEYLRQQSAPLDRYSQLAGILAGTPYSGSSQTKQPGSVLNTVLGVGGIAASIFSDARLKEDVVATGEKWHGLPVFEFGYKDVDGMDLPAGRQRGVMAQDAILEYPDAVSVGNNGYLQIDYGHIARGNIQ